MLCTVVYNTVILDKNQSSFSLVLIDCLYGTNQFTSLHIFHAQTLSNNDINVLSDILQPEIREFGSS